MGTINKVDKVKLIMGLLFNPVIDIKKIYEILEEKFGAIDKKTEPYNFQFTNYYNKEMGNSIQRQFISFEKLIEMTDLSDIKISTNEIEMQNSNQQKRNINIDPGYIELGKLVLASTKNYTHRIYIGKGIFAEPTLQFYKKTFAKWPFTYPDYSDDFSVNFFNEARLTYKAQLEKPTNDIK